MHQPDTHSCETSYSLRFPKQTIPECIKFQKQLIRYENLALLLPVPDLTRDYLSAMKKQTVELHYEAVILPILELHVFFYNVRFHGQALQQFHLSPFLQ